MPPTPLAPDAVAANTSNVFQVIWQIQQGCQTYCWATSQTQVAVQLASTTQTATAQGSSAAVAANTSFTAQFAWQFQIGCMAFCYGTSQTQLAVQLAETVQIAVALAGLGVGAGNLAETIQQVWQVQQGCREECHDTSQSQSLAQGQSTSESAIAVADGGQSDVSLPALGADGLPVPPEWLLALALNVGATIQMIFQYEEAACLNHCGGDVQEQSAGQQANTVQDALALAGEPPEEPPVETAPTELPATPVTGPSPPGASPPVGDAVATAAGATRVTVHDARHQTRARRPTVISLRHDARLRRTTAVSVRHDARLRRTTVVSVHHDARLRRTSADLTVRRNPSGDDAGPQAPATTAADDMRAAAATDISRAPALSSALPESTVADDGGRLGQIALLAGALGLAVVGASLMRRRFGQGVRP